MGDDEGEDQEDGFGLRVSGEDGGEEVSGGAADVDEGLEGGEVVGGGDGIGLGAVDADHGFGEEGGLVGVLGEVVEDGHSHGVVEAGVAGLDGIEEVVDSCADHGAGHGEDGGAGGAGGGGLEGLAEGGEGEAVVGVLGDEAEVTEGAEEAVEGGGVSVGEGAEFVGGLRADGEVVGEVELGGDEEDLGDPVGGGHLNELGVRGEGGRGVGGHGGASVNMTVVYCVRK